LSPMELESPAGVIAVATESIARLAAKQDDPKKQKADWTSKPFNEIAAVIIAKNAILVTGLDRDAKDANKTQPGLIALSLADGKTLWKQPLPAHPVAWGLA